MTLSNLNKDLNSDVTNPRLRLLSELLVPFPISLARYHGRTQLTAVLHSTAVVDIYRSGGQRVCRAEAIDFSGRVSDLQWDQEGAWNLSCVNSVDDQKPNVR